MGYHIIDNANSELKKTFSLTFYDTKDQPYTREITILRKIGEGSSCYCYDVLVRFDDKTEHKMVLKQFYPIAYARETKIEQRGAELFIDGYEYLEKIQKLGNGFERAFEIQNHLANREDLMGVLVHPYEKYFSGSTKYVLYEANNGKSMEKLSLGSDIRKLLFIIKEAAISLSYLHKHRILHMDLAPDNILWVDDSKVKFFDFDSIIEMDKIEDVHEFRGRPELLAPELAMEQNIEQNKKLILKPQVDIYSLACILFYYIFQRYPSNEEKKNHGYKKELYKILEENYGKLFSEVQKKQLFQIIQQGIHYYVGKRYKTAEKMGQDLEKILKVFDKLEDDPKEASKVNYMLLAGYILHKYPLFQYKCEKKSLLSEEAQKQTQTHFTNIVKEEYSNNNMDITIIGSSVLRDAFVKNIFSCAQMLDTKLIIRIVSEDIKEYFHDLLTLCPLLGGVTDIYLDNQPYLYNGSKLSKAFSVTKTPFAEIYGYEIDSTLEKIPFLSNYYLLVDDNYAKNYKLAEIIGELFSENKEQKVFIGCGYTLWKKDWKELKDRYSNIDMERIECNAVYTIVEKNFHQGIYKMALGIHTFYTKEWNETASAKEIWQDFKRGKNSHYNIKSSLRSALSIPYKLASCGIISNANPAKLFYQKVLSGSKEAQKNKNRMIYLEHRSWMCFMIMEGYRCPTKTELKSYFYQGNHDHRNIEKKLHPCICECLPENGLMLKNLSKKQWNNSMELKQNYDELDLSSLRMHQMCQKRKEEVKTIGIDLFERLERELVHQRLDSSYIEECEWLRILFFKMLEEETNSNILWKEESQKYLQHLKSARKELEEIFQRICQEMRVIEERNEYHDYKSSDATILDAIPRLLMKKPIRKIYKLISKKNWENVVSSIIIEPEELILVVEKLEDISEKEQNAIREFFKSRGLEKMKVTTICQDKVMIKKNSPEFLIDITGAKENMIFTFFLKENRRKSCVIYYKNGKLEELAGEGELLYYNQKKSLTVESTFSLFWANVFSIRENNDMIDLCRNYQDLWSAYIAVKPFEWRVFVKLVEEWEKENCWKIEYKKTKLLQKAELLQRKTLRTIHLRAIKDCNMDKVLDSMKRNQLIVNYKLPIEMDNIIIETKNPKIVKIVDAMIEKVNLEPYQHRFFFKKTHRDLVTGTFLQRNMFYIKDETNVFSVEFQNEKLFGIGEKGSDIKYDKAEAVKNVLLALYRQGKKGKRESILIKLPDRELITKEENGKVKISFQFFNRATKICLLKEGNVLEQYTYHTIRQNTTLSDVKMNVEFMWNVPKEDDIALHVIINEIDLVCCMGLQTYFISCKQSRPVKEFLNEIKYYADYFGIDAKAIIICSNQDQNYTHQMEYFAKRSESMGVYMIDRDLIGKEEEDIKSGKLAKVIQNIVDGKENWREVNENKEII